MRQFSFEAQYLCLNRTAIPEADAVHDLVEWSANMASLACLYQESEDENIPQSQFTLTWCNCY